MSLVNCLVFCSILVLFNIVPGSCTANYKITYVTVPEGICFVNILWHLNEHALYWSDVANNTFYRMDGETGVITKREICFGEATFILPVAGYPTVKVIGIGTSIFTMEWPSGKPRFITAVDLGRPRNCFCFGGSDAKGNLWTGTRGHLELNTSELVEPDQGSLYRVNLNGVTCSEVMIRPLSACCGVVKSPDGKTVYVIDSPKRLIFAWDYNSETGKITHQRVVIDFYESGIDGYPHHMTIDTDGNLWVTTYIGRKIIKIDPHCGDILLAIAIDTNAVTGIGWGGCELNRLYFGTGIPDENSKIKSAKLGYIDGLGAKGLPTNEIELSNIYC